MATEIIDEVRTFVILTKHGESPKTLRVPLIKGALLSLLKETYSANPHAKVDVLTIEIEKSEGDVYHIYPSKIDIIPRIKDGLQYLKENDIAEPIIEEKVKTPKN